MSTKTTAKPQVFTYSDYREYIRDLLQWRKNRNLPAALRDLKIEKPGGGLYSAQFLSQVFRGKKPLPDAMLKGLGKFFKLNRSEKLFLQRLATYRLAGDVETRQDAWKRLAWRSEFRESQGVGSRQRLDFISHGFVGDVYLLTALPGFCPNAGWINAHLRLPLGKSEINEALDVLQALSLIEICHDGSVRRVPGPIPTPDLGEAELFNMYHLEQLEKARQALSELPLEDREFYAWGVSRFTPDKYRQFKKKLTARMAKVLQETVAEFESDADDATVVARVNLNVLPVSRLKEQDHES